MMRTLSGYTLQCSELILSLCLGITPGGPRGPYGVSSMEPTLLLLQPLDENFKIHIIIEVYMEPFMKIAMY